MVDIPVEKRDLRQRLRQIKRLGECDALGALSDRGRHRHEQYAIRPGDVRIAIVFHWTDRANNVLSRIGCPHGISHWLARAIKVKKPRKENENEKGIICS